MLNINFSLVFRGIWAVMGKSKLCTLKVDEDDVNTNLFITFFFDETVWMITLSVFFLVFLCKNWFYGHVRMKCYCEVCSHIKLLQDTGCKIISSEFSALFFTATVYSELLIIHEKLTLENPPKSGCFFFMDTLEVV